MRQVIDDDRKVNNIRLQWKYYELKKKAGQSPYQRRKLLADKDERAGREKKFSVQIPSLKRRKTDCIQ